MNLAIIGAGLIGRKRAQALPKYVKLLFVCDTNKEKAREFARDFECSIESSWKKIIKDPKLDAIIISTPNKYLSLIAQAAILEGKHVLIEKPGGLNIKQLQNTYNTFKQKKVVVMYGYNHRYHPALQKAKQVIETKKYGPILFLRARYGHGGRVGYEKEWRFQKNLSGGGELIDQGCHLIDLVNFFCGEMNQTEGFIANMFWKTKLEDVAFFHLRNKNNQIADLSVTCVEWKNIFSFEILLQKAKIQIDGLGRSYGKEKLTLYTMSEKMGPPSIEEFEFDMEDISWKKENETFFKRIKSNDTSDKSFKEAMYVLSIIEKIYRQNKL